VFDELPRRRRCSHRWPAAKDSVNVQHQSGQKLSLSVTKLAVSWVVDQQINACIPFSKCHLKGKGTWHFWLKEYGLIGLG
jgi:hypothetical protein